jgi:V8-like Glu-specific endopeptidase
MKKLLTLLSLTLVAQAHAVIYDQDNRQDIFEVRNQLHTELAKSTAAMIPLKKLTRARQNFFDIKDAESLERKENICPNEKFAEQPAAAICSGFLVSPDTLVTAGHCFRFNTPAKICESFAWVFDFQMTARNSHPTRNISVNNIYMCKQVLAAQLKSDLDFTVIKLDRPVVGRRPLKFKQQGKISPSTPLVVIGYPTGLPLKVSPGGKITRNDRNTMFSTNLDTFHGNSGSGVFNAETGEIVGVLIQGKDDYIPSKKEDPNSCKVVNQCDSRAKNCSAGKQDGTVKWGEVVLRIESASQTINKGIKTKVR